ncbi:MAG: hypothetical protein AAFZ63_21155 [Bacteroidota bacterium]
MKRELVTIELYDKREKVTSTLCVQQLGERQFKMVDNALFNCRLTFDTEFETRINSDGKHEIVRISKASDYTTRRFMLSAAHTEADYRMLGDELTNRGGFWQVDMGSIATVNIPKGFEYDLDQVIEDLGLSLIEIVNDLEDER